MYARVYFAKLILPSFYLDAGASSLRCFVKGVNPTLYPPFPSLFLSLPRFFESQIAILNSIATARDSANDAAKYSMLAFELLGLSMEERSLQGYGKLCADAEASDGVWWG